MNENGALSYVSDGTAPVRQLVLNTPAHSDAAALTSLTQTTLSAVSGRNNKTAICKTSVTEAKQESIWAHDTPASLTGRSHDHTGRSLTQ